VTNKFCGLRAATEEGTMILVNSKDVVADRIRDLQAQAAGPRPRSHRQRRGTWRGLASLGAVRALARPLA
jgi:hypothetical protein